MSFESSRFRKICHLKIFSSNFSSSGHFVCQSKTVCAVLVGAFVIWTSGSGDVSLNRSYLELWWPSCSAEQKDLGKFNRGPKEEHLCGVVLNLDHG